MSFTASKLLKKKGLTRGKIRSNLPAIMKTNEQKSSTIGQLSEKAGGLAFREDVTASLVPHEPPAFSDFFSGE